ncbi:MAG: hypothetical protein ABI600_06880 [Luteolibacter sp.]
MLEAAENRKAAEWSRKGRKVTLVILIPTAALILWAAVFLIQYQAEHPTVETPPKVVAAATPVPAEAPKDVAQYDAFLPKALRVVKPAETHKDSGEIIDKGDIRFAMELLNYVQPPVKPEPKPRQ